MIVLDEQIHGPRIRSPISKWYKGQVISIRELRSASTIHDDAIPNLLRTVSQPTFVTINGSDFWLKINADKRFAVVCIELTNERAFQSPYWLRRFLSFSEFDTKAKRMGLIALLRPTRIEFYRANRKIETMNWK